MKTAEELKEFSEELYWMIERGDFIKTVNRLHKLQLDADRAGWLRAQQELAEIVDNCHLTFAAGDETVIAEDACPSIRKALLDTEYKEPTT